MKYIFLTVLILMFSGCSKKEHTEGFIRGGFKDGASTKIKYDEGGKTTFRAKLESEIYEKLMYPIELKVFLNEAQCASSIAIEPKNNPFNIVECTKILGSGLHEFRVEVISSHGFDYLSEKEDLQLNTISGSLTYTLQEGW